MKFRTILTGTVMAAALAQAVAADFREHRGVYLTPYVKDWPTGPIYAHNAQTHKNILTKHLDRLKAGGVNVLYFAVRPMCDAAYNSKYEPWSASFSGTRGVAPPFDPLQFVVDECHERGIEVFLWLNAYRYCSASSHGESPLDYENTHPEWLLAQEHETILNPALEEVKQRVCDVAADVVDNYDVDGFLFDDYYYTNKSPLELDAEYYNAAKGDKEDFPDQLQWRRDNVSDMVRRVSETVKSHKPWVAFGIKPAGVASPPNLRDYGLEALPASVYETDWQYNGVCADPVYWYSQHWCDFLAPQIYWCDLYTPLETWWAKASAKFDRHLFSAVSMSDFDKYGMAEFAREAAFGREVLPQNTNGIGFFRWQYYVNNDQKIDGVRTKVAEYMGQTAFAVPALSPVRPWNNVYSPEYITGLKRQDGILQWETAQAGRYTVYAFPAGTEASMDNKYLVQVRYTNSFTIPAGMEDYTFGVGVYDRYGNEYPITTEGAQPSAPVAAQLLYPAQGTQADDLFEFEWDAPAQADCVLEVADNPEFENLIVQMPARGGCVNSNVANERLTAGSTYWWRVRTMMPNAPVGVAEARSFTATHVTITGPEGNENPITPTLTWTPAYSSPETAYLVEISRNRDFTLLDYSSVSTDNSLTVPAGALVSGYNYFARVTATRGNCVSVSPTARFATADKVYEAPLFITPGVEGAEMGTADCIEVEGIDGITSVTIQICTDDSFSARKRYQLTAKKGTQPVTPALENVYIAGKRLEDGKTYYVRTAANYFTQESSSSEKQTSWRVTTFKYNGSGSAPVTVADADAVSIDADAILRVPASGCRALICTPDGRVVFSTGNCQRETDLSHLPGGLYIVRVSGTAHRTLKWVK